MYFALSLIAAFLIGSIPTGYLLGLLNGIDLRKAGSGNTGATNAGRVLGKKAGVITLAIDIFKGIFGIQIAWAITGLFGDSSFSQSSELDPSALFGLATICGHCFSPWLSFKGGKGVATGVGVFLVVAPPQALIALVAFAVTFYFTRIVSLSSILATSLVPISLLLNNDKPEITICAGLAAALIIYRHRDNITRIIAGTEKQFTLKKEDAEDGATESPDPQKSPDKAENAKR